MDRNFGYSLTRHNAVGAYVERNLLTYTELVEHLRKQRVLGPAMATGAIEAAERGDAPVRLPGHASYLTITAIACPHEYVEDNRCQFCGRWVIDGDDIFGADLLESAADEPHTPVERSRTCC